MNVSSTNFAKYLFDDTDDKRYLEDICSMQSLSLKMLFWTFFSLFTNFHNYHILPFHVFCKEFCKYLTKYMKPNIHLKTWTLLNYLEEKWLFLDQKWARNYFLLLKISKMSIDMWNSIVHCWPERHLCILLPKWHAFSHILIFWRLNLHSEGDQLSEFDQFGRWYWCSDGRDLL